MTREEPLAPWLGGCPLFFGGCGAGVASVGLVAVRAACSPEILLQDRPVSRKQRLEDKLNVLAVYEHASRGFSRLMRVSLSSVNHRGPAF